MSIDRLVMAFAGSFVLISLALRWRAGIRRIGFGLPRLWAPILCRRHSAAFARWRSF